MSSTTPTNPAILSSIFNILNNDTRDEAIFSALAILIKYVHTIEFFQHRQEILVKINKTFLQRMLLNDEMYEFAITLLAAFSNPINNNYSECLPLLADIKIPIPSDKVITQTTSLHQGMIQVISNLAPVSRNNLPHHIDVLLYIIQKNFDLLQQQQQQTSDNNTILLPTIELALSVLQNPYFTEQISTQQIQKMVHVIIPKKQFKLITLTLTCLASCPALVNGNSTGLRDSIKIIIEFIDQLLHHKTLQIPTDLRNACLHMMSVLCMSTNCRNWIIPSLFSSNFVLVLCQASSIEIAVAFEYEDKPPDTTFTNSSLIHSLQLLDSLIGYFLTLPQRFNDFTDNEIQGIITAVDRTVKCLCRFCIHASTSSNSTISPDENLLIVSCIITCLYFFLYDDEFSGQGLLAIEKTCKVSKVFPWIIRHCGPPLLANSILSLVARLWIFSSRQFDLSGFNMDDVIQLLRNKFCVTTFSASSIENQQTDVLLLLHAGLVIVGILDSIQFNAMDNKLQDNEFLQLVESVQEYSTTNLSQHDVLMDDQALAYVALQGICVCYHMMIVSTQHPLMQKQIQHWLEVSQKILDKYYNESQDEVDDPIQNFEIHTINELKQLLMKNM
jgi:hypothetical protein